MTHAIQENSMENTIIIYDNRRETKAECRNTGLTHFLLNILNSRNFVKSKYALVIYMMQRL